MKHLKSFLFAASFLAAISSVDAQSFQKGDQTAQIGLGIGGSFATGTITVPPIQVRYEKAIHENISVGGVLGYASSKFSYHDSNINWGTGDVSLSDADIKYRYFLIGARGNYHFLTENRFDPYIGATLGYNKVGTSDSADNFPDIQTSAVLYGAQIGSNYHFTDKIGAWAELGYGLGVLNVGITFKF